MTKQAIATGNAPDAIGPYSQAVRAGDTLYVSGQIPLVPGTMELVEGDIDAEIRRVLDNLLAIVEAGGARPEAVVKVHCYLTDLGQFPRVNEIMAEYFAEPYPARAALGVAALPKGARVEMDAIVSLAG